MTAGWIYINIAIAVAVTLIVALPAVLIPLLLDRGMSPHAPSMHRAAGADASHRDAHDERENAA